MSNAQSIKQRIDDNVIPTYARFPITLTHGKGCHVFDADGKRYLDLGAGIATACLGHGQPELATALADQAGKLTHVSNLYYTEPQGLLAEKLVKYAGGSGKVFFCNSGAEANETLFKLARLNGEEKDRFEICLLENCKTDLKSVEIDPDIFEICLVRKHANCKSVFCRGSP